jgi:hypothetical protein
MARCMVKTKKLPGYFCGEAVSTVVHILNRSPNVHHRQEDTV